MTFAANGVIFHNNVDGVFQPFWRSENVAETEPKELEVKKVQSSEC